MITTLQYLFWDSNGLILEFYLRKNNLGVNLRVIGAGSDVLLEIVVSSRVL